MLKRLRKLLGQEARTEPVSLTVEPRLLTEQMRVAYAGQPIRLEIGGQVLRLYPDFSLNPDKRKGIQDWVVIDPKRYFKKLAGFVRIKRGETVLFGRENERCKAIFGLTKPVARRHLEMSNDKGDLLLEKIDPEAKTYVSRIADPEEMARLDAERLGRLPRVREFFGGPIELVAPDEALATLSRVNEIMRSEAYRVVNSEGVPGGLLELPDGLAPLIVGDLHARVDNLLKVLAETQILDGLERGDAYLLFLGDAVHSEEDGELDKMDTSLLIMDLIFKLKVRFPRNVFYLRGNHDSFDEALSKAGIPQGIIFRQRAQELRGDAYVAQLAEFFEGLPYVVKSKDFISCHAAPTRSEVGLQMLIDIRRYPGLAHELTWTRLQRPGYPAGYTKRSVKKFRSALGVAKHMPFIVGHTHLSRDETVWLNVGEIKNHHVLMSANTHNVGVFIRADREMVPLEYTAEPLLALVNAPAEKRGDQHAPAAQPRSVDRRAASSDQGNPLPLAQDAP